MSYTLTEPLPTLTEIRAGQFACNRAKYLRGLSAGELADWVGALSAECICRGIQIQVPACEMQARIEAWGQR